MIQGGMILIIFKVCFPSYWMGSKNIEFDRNVAITRIMTMIIVMTN